MIDVLLVVSSLCLGLNAVEPGLAPVDPGRVYQHVQYLAGTIGLRQYGSYQDAQAADYILDTYQSYGLSDVGYQYFSAKGYVGTNVIGRVVGTTYPAAVVVIGAHFDSYKGVGAVDNATGVATMLELAYQFAAEPLDYTVEFVAFDGEEYGLLGSKYYVETAKSDQSINQMIFVYNLDMTQSNDTSPDEPGIFECMTPNASNRAAYSAAREAIGSHGRHIVPVPIFDPLVRLLESDINNWQGLNINVGWPWAYDKDYNTAKDTLAKVNAQALAWTTRFSLEFLRVLMSNPPERLRQMEETRERPGVH
jgi:hypothetical protein